MTHARPEPNVDHPVMRLLKELYLSTFVLFFRISRWRGNMKARSAALGLTLVDGILVMSFGASIAVVTHQVIEVNRWIVGIAVIVLYSLNDYFLVDQGRGIAFEERFRGFRAGKRTLLYLAASGIVLATGIALYFSAAAYHQTFNLPRK